MNSHQAEQPSMELLLSQAQQLCNTPYFQNVIVQHCQALANQPNIELITSIHSNDQMLTHSLFHHRDANAAFSQYYNVGLQQFNAAQQILDALFPGEQESIQFLDFACGYGRLLRFMSQYLPQQHLFASEIQADALAHVKKSFNTQTIASHANPKDFLPEKKFDLIWVASLFSHLPRELFHAWLQRLVATLTPNGVLCFSVHDACLVPEGHDFPEQEGYLFWPQSENADLDSSLYGTTYVNETFVAAMIASVCGAEHSYYRIPRGLAHEQDIYVIANNTNRNLKALEGFRRGPWGWVDERSLTADGDLYLRGWAASVDDGPLDTIKITINNALHQCPTGKNREDVGRVFADSRLNSSGWEFRYQLPKNTDCARIQVTAETDRGERALLYTGDLFRPKAPEPTSVHEPLGFFRRALQQLKKS